MWAGTEWDSVHKDIYNYAKCDIHKHAHLEDMLIGVWEKSDRDLFEKWVRLRVMEPFLFMQTYSFPTCSLWAKAADLLPKENFISDGRVDGRTKDIITLVDTVAYHLPWMLQFLHVLSQNCQQTRSLVMQNKRTFGDLQKCCLFEDACKCVASNELYKIFKKYVPLHKYNEKKLTAAFCITFVLWHQLQEEDWYQTRTTLGTDLNEEQQAQKKLGNDEFKDNMFYQAVASYTKIIKKIPDNAIIYGNRAQAYIKLAKFDEAEVDGRRVVILDSTNYKGYLRMVKAKEGLMEYHSGHELATFAFKVCSSSGKPWADIFDFGEQLKNQCEISGECSKDRRFKHQITSPILDKTNSLPELLSSAEESSDQEDEGVDLIKVVDPSSGIQEGTVSLEPVKMFKFNLLELLQQQKVLQQEGSEALLKGKPQEAANKYLQALEILPQLSEQNFDTDVEDKVCLKYALGVAYQRGPSEKLMDSLEIFQEILNNHGDLNFSPAHSGIGETYMKLFRFDQALEHLTHALESVEKGKIYRTYNWPGTKNVIEDSIPEKHKERMAELVQNCQFPPNPDAVCRSDYCLLPSKNIYFGDPEFKGYYRLCCESDCKLEYHSQCWKRVKETLDRNRKGVVGQVCLTPDCGQPVVGLEKFDNYGNLLSKSGSGMDKENKPKKAKSEKKSSQKELKKQQKRKERPRQASVCDNEDQDINTLKESLNPEPNNSKETESVKALPPSYNVNDEPAYVIRKGDPDINNFGQNDKNSSVTLNGLAPGTVKRKAKKSKKQTTVSVQEFCGELLENDSYYNQYLKRVQQLQQAKNRVEEDDVEEEWPALTPNFTLNPDSPFFVPEHLRNNPEELEKVLQRHFQLAQEKAQQEEEIKETIYTYLEDFLRANGPVRKDSDLLAEEVNCFPEPTLTLINSYGGLECFLKQSGRFILEENVLYAASEFSKHPVPSSVNPTSTAFWQALNANSEENILEGISDGPTVVQDPKKITKDFCGVQGKHPEHFETEDKKKVVNYDIEPVQDERPVIQRSESLESNKSNFGINNEDQPSSTKALKTIHKVAKSLSNDLKVALFKLQVCVTALSTEDQEQVACSILNSVKPNYDIAFWTSVNSKLNSVQVSMKGSISEDQEQGNKARYDQLLMTNKNLEERLSSALDTISQLQNAQSLNKSKYEDEVKDLKTKNQKLQAKLNTLQTRMESDKQHLQQERNKVKEEAANLKTEKEEEVATAHKLLMKVTVENEELKTKLNKERDDKVCLNKTISTLMENCEDATKQLQSTKEELVKLKEREGLKLLERELESVIKLKAQLLDNKKKEQGHPTLSSSVFEVLVEKPLQDCEVYLKSIKDLKNSFLTLVNKHLEALQRGVNPPEITLDIPVLPPRPESLLTMNQAALAALGTPLFQLSSSSLPPVSTCSVSQKSSPVSVPQTSTASTAPNIFPNFFRPPVSVPPQPYLQQGPRPDVPVVPNLGSNFNTANMLPIFQHNRPTYMAAQSPVNIFPVPMMRYPPGTPVPVMGVNNPESEKTVVSASPTPITNISLKQRNLVPTSQPQETLSSMIASADCKSDKSSANNQSSIPSAGVPSIDVNAITAGQGLNRAPLPVPPGMAPLTNMKNLQDNKSEMHSSQLLPSATSGLSVKSKVPLHSASQKIHTLSATGASAPAAVPKNNFDKLIRKLQESHPMMTSAELNNYVQEFRSQRRGLSGMLFESIIEGVTALIQKSLKQEGQKARVITPAFERGGSRDESARHHFSGLESIEKNSLVKGNNKDPWGAASSSSPNWEGSDDHTCSICLDSMLPPAVIHQTDCKHRFHFKCIQEWLKRTSKCPNCNSHTLLPTEFPPLGS